MTDLPTRLETIDDPRPPHKVKHLLKDIISIVLFTTLANVNEWIEIACFAQENEAFLRQYFQLPNGIPSHDTLARVMGLISPGSYKAFT